jgi:hypothetical protein
MKWEMQLHLVWMYKQIYTECFLWSESIHSFCMNKSIEIMREGGKMVLAILLQQESTSC